MYKKYKGVKRLSVHTVLGQGVVERQCYTQCRDGRQNIHTVHVGGQGGRMHTHLNMADIKGGTGRMYSYYGEGLVECTLW